MKRFILTGMPGSGKTSIIRALAASGYTVIRESATDIIHAAQGAGIPDPWKRPPFIDDIIRLQRDRQLKAPPLKSTLQFYDRSPICTYALSAYLGIQSSQMLTSEIHRILTNHIYEKCLFFIENMGFIENTPARTIRFEEALTFEKMHLNTYKKFGYTIIPVPKDSIHRRMAFILDHIFGKKPEND